MKTPTTVDIADRARRERDAVIRERDAILALCYRKVETRGVDRETYYRLTIPGLDRRETVYETEVEAIAAVYRHAGLDGHLVDTTGVEPR